MNAEALPHPEVTDPSVTPPPPQRGTAAPKGLPGISPRAIETAATRSLPDDLLKLAVRRLKSIAQGGLVTLVVYALLLNVVVPRGTLPAELRNGYFRTVVVALLLNLVMYLVARSSRFRPSMVLAVGYGYIVAFSLALGWMRHSHSWPSTELLRQWSPVAMLLLAFGALVPARPSRVLLVCMSAAATEPLALYIMRGRQTLPAGGDWLLLSTPPLLGIFLGYGASLISHELGESIAKAREFGSYRLTERLGVGGLAEVWRAEHSMLARPAAVKLIRPEVLAAHGEAEAVRLTRLFAHEAQITAKLTSPHTIEVFDFGVAKEGALYFVVELLDGLDLQTLVDNFGRLPPERVAFLLRQICDSLAEAHGREFVHRDVKPANIFTCRYGGGTDFVKVLDFGLVMDRRPTPEELEERRLVGTPAVMAPEMIRFDAKVDYRADIYAFGCVAYWLLTGERVFEAASKADMLVMHAHQKPTAPSKRIKVELPKVLEDLIMSCLEKNPNKRPSSMRDVADLLDASGLPQQWTRLRANEWWAQHGPAPKLP